MPRGIRLDAPGTLHHVMARGIEGRRIIEGDKDRIKFISQNGDLVLDSGTSMYARVLMDNQAHFLLESGNHGLSGFIVRLLFAYASYFNSRYWAAQIMRRNFLSNLSTTSPFHTDFLKDAFIPRLP